jgi:hypothetical protein
MHDPKLEIAACLLSTLIGQSDSRSLTERGEDIEHCLEVADELIRRRHDHGSPLSDLAYRPPLSTKIREEVVQRDPMPLKGQLDRRRAKDAFDAPGPSPGRRPTLH